MATYYQLRHLMRLRVDIFHQGKLLERVAANQYRKTLKQAGYGDGLHGFGLKLPSISDLNAQEITAKVVGTDYILPVANNFTKITQPLQFGTKPLSSFSSSSFEKFFHGICECYTSFPDTFMYRIFNILYYSKFTSVLKALRSSLKRVIR